MRTSMIVLVLLCAAACAQTADRQAVDQDEAAMQAATDAYNAAQANEGERVVCKMEAVTGTRMKQKVCRKVSEMERDEETAERIIRETKPLPPGSR